MLLKLEKILFYAFLFLIPLQLRATISWQGSEWDSIFLYLTDLLLVGFLFLAIINKRISFKKNDVILFLFLIIAGISIFVSSDLGISVYRFIKLLEFFVLYLYIKATLITNFTRMTRILQILIASGIVQSILAIAQFYKQGSLGLKFIEAGQYLPGVSGVATFLMGDDKIMRAYGSFPHPNVLAGFLLLSIFALYAKILSKPIRPIGPISLIGLILLIFSLFLTFSRGPILVFLIVSMIFFLLRFFQLRNTYHAEERLLAGEKLINLTALFIVSCILVIIVLNPYLKARFFTISLQEEAIDLRFFYNKIALAIIKDKPLLGIGIGNFVNFSHNYPVFIRVANAVLSGGGQGDVEIPQWLYQPVHNIYLLIGSEIGILGLIVFGLFLLFNLLGPARLKNPMWFVFIGFLVLALSDHLFWTLQSGGLMFWLGLAMSQDNL